MLRAKLTVEYTDMTTTLWPGRGARQTFLLAATFLASLAVTSPARAAQFFLENPANGTFRSGVAVLSGWVCDAETVEIDLVGAERSETVQASYGTPRADTATEAHCGVGDEDNGFGALTNLNRLGTGPATATLKIDGVEVVTNDFFVVKPTSANFNFDLSGAYTLPGFPGDGEAVDIVWTSSLQGFGMAPAGSSPATAASGSSACPSGFGTSCTVENPTPSQFMSGVVVFSGWVCDVIDSIRLVLKGVDRTEEIIPAYGTDRLDTSAVCGDSDNGFGALSNVNRLGHGPAMLELWIDDEMATSYSFFVTKPSDENFMRGVDGEYVLPDFPVEGETTTVVFQTSDQNYSIKDVSVGSAPTPTPVPGSIPTPGITPTPSPEPTASPDGTPTPDPGDPTPTPDATPTPDTGPVCGNGIQEDPEQCDGTDFGIFVDGCEDVFGGFNPDGDACQSDTLLCTSDCRIDGSLCSCLCEEDFDCILPEGELIDCTAEYCTTDFCEPGDIADCECSIGDQGDLDGACLGSNSSSDLLGFCVVTPFDPGENNSALNELCTGFDGQDPDFPRCDFCDF